MKTFNQIEKEIDEIVRHEFFYNNIGFDHNNLCYIFSGSKFEELWREYWFKFNYKDRVYIPSYILTYDEFYRSNFLEVEALTRLMVVEDFKLYCFNWVNK